MIEKIKEKRPIIALDFPEKKDVAAFLAKFPGSEKLFVKIGMEIFYREGPAIIEFIKNKGHSLFLDLKLYDIPNTVQAAMRNIAHFGVDITNVHAAGGIEMMQAALIGLKDGAKSLNQVPKLLAVTQLTSINTQIMQKEQLVNVSLVESVVNYAKNAASAGLAGVVCSALEVKKIKAATNDNFLCLTPGIRPENAALGDQKRVVTPHMAHRIGSDYIVIGRPITQATDPVATYLKIKAEFNESIEIVE